MNDCDHENTTEILFDAKLDQHTRRERKYEVVYCKDCNRMLNLYQADEMTADQVVELFRDIQYGIQAIDAAKDDLHKSVEETLRAFRNL